MATGRVSLLKFKATDTVSAGSRSSKRLISCQAVLSVSHEFRFGRCIVKNVARAKRLSRPVVGWVFSVQTGIVWLATQIFDNLVGRRSNVRQNFE